MTDLRVSWRERWLVLAEAWESRAAEAGLSDILEALRGAFHPLMPLAAQLLYVSQPTFALFGQADAVGALAELLMDGSQPRRPGRHNEPPRPLT